LDDWIFILSEWSGDPPYQGKNHFFLARVRQGLPVRSLSPVPPPHALIVAHLVTDLILAGPYSSVRPDGTEWSADAGTQPTDNVNLDER